MPEIVSVSIILWVGVAESANFSHSSVFVAAIVQIHRKFPELSRFLFLAFAALPILHSSQSVVVGSSFGVG